MSGLRLTTRGWVVLYCLVALALTGLLVWVDSMIAVPGVDDARVDAELLR